VTLWRPWTLMAGATQERRDVLDFVEGAKGHFELARGFFFRPQRKRHANISDVILLEWTLTPIRRRGSLQHGYVYARWMVSLNETCCR
jgi:hypothetical protein